jgi:cytochrome c peroxidase
MRLGGPLPGIDTPTLRGLFLSAPYLHDGSAPTLRAVLRDRNPDDRHGVTSDLSDAQLEDLVAYLLSLE